MCEPLQSLLNGSHLLSADQLADAVSVHAALMGAREAVVYLADYQQASLLPLPGRGVPGRQELPIEGTMAGWAFRRVKAMTSAPASGPGRLWVPLVDGVQRLGVIELVFGDDAGPPQLTDPLRALCALVAELLVVKDAYSDTFARLRRRKTLSLAAEIQWELLPPLTFADDQLVITGGLEPAYEIGGDTFDYAVSEGIADIAVLDAVGHGLPAALLASAAIGAYRHARRNRLELPQIAGRLDEVIAAQFPGSQFATAILARLDTMTGRLRWVNAGHPHPLILRGTTLLTTDSSPPQRPLGLQDAPPLCREIRLEPGDRVLLHTDGITEARSPDGEYFGEARLADFITAAASTGEPAPETLRRLTNAILTHQADQLQDDASIVMVEWRAGKEGATTP